MARIQLSLCGRSAKDSAGSVIDAAAQVGGDSIRIQGLSFGVSDPTDAMKLAREGAVIDAKTQAEQYCGAAGVLVGSVQSIRTLTADTVTPVMTRMSFAKVGSVPLEGGAMEVSAEVDVVFEILD